MVLSPAKMEQIRAFAEEVAVREGCRLYDLEFHEGPNRTLRIFIDKQPGGVTLEDCVNVSRGLNLRLDVEDAIPGGRYELEVSSPGLERKLTQLWHFSGAIGQTVQLRYRDAAGDIKSYEGHLDEVRDSELVFSNSKGIFTVDYGQVERARVLLSDPFPKRPAPGKKKR